MNENPRIYLQLPMYLREWLRHDFWNEEKQCVVFPKGGAEHIALSLSLKKHPGGNLPTYSHDPDALPIEVPCFPGRNAQTYSYLNDVGRNMLVSTIKKRFKFMLWDELHCTANMNIQITDLIYVYMDRHGISFDPKNWETIRQMYSRMRKVYTAEPQS